MWTRKRICEWYAYCIKHKNAGAYGITEHSQSLMMRTLYHSYDLVSCRHPLFPLLALLFEKCEQATQGSECITSASFDVDIENFVHQQEQDHKPFFSEDPELDNLVCIQKPLAVFILSFRLMCSVQPFKCTKYFSLQTQRFFPGYTNVTTAPPSAGQNIGIMHFLCIGGEMGKLCLFE